MGLLEEIKPFHPGISETDPNNLKPGDPGAKMDAGKIKVGLLRRFGLALMAVADLATGGAEKYSAHGWVEVKNGAERYEDALLGHLLKEMFEEKDPDMGVPHEVSVAWNALARLQLLIEKDPTWRARLLARKATPHNVGKVEYKIFTNSDSGGIYTRTPFDSHGLHLGNP